MGNFLDVALLSAPFATYSYAVPDWFSDLDWPEGLRLLVPLGTGSRVGLVRGRTRTAPEGVNVKPILWPLERAPLFDAAYLEVMRHLAARQTLDFGRILGTFLPSGLRSGTGAFEVFDKGMWRALSVKRLKSAPEAELRRLAALWAEGRMRPRPAAGEGDEAVRYAPGVEPPWPVRPGARRQIAVLDHLFDQGPAEASALRGRFGPDIGPTLRRMAELGLIRPLAADDPGSRPARSGEPPERRSPPESLCPGQPPTPEQAAALASLRPALLSFSGQAWLVHGVTGSGKTRLYLELARDCLAAGRPALLLAPEVALAARLFEAARQAFPGLPALFFHGSLSPARREALFREAAALVGPFLAVGTRSALFLPVKNPGLIVLDEEHDASFKQDERLIYQAKEVAYVLARQTGALLVLGSATPDVKTFYAVRRGAVPMVGLRERAGAGRPPEVELVDMRGAAKITSLAGERETGDRSGTLTVYAAEALGETVERGEQAIILLNRRGYAPLLYCLSCEQTLRCPHCELALTYHKGRERLLCHYCGLARDFPSPCAACGGSEFLPMGVGAELLEEQLAGVLPTGARVLRLDRDSARLPGKAEALLAEFAAGKAQVMVGTQMLSKGHDFPNVTLVVAADGDMGRNLPDYRSAERTFQLLVQALGRAGRGAAPGRALIQTRNPNDPFWRHVMAADYQSFYEGELERRRRFGYPPFSKLALVRLSFPREREEELARVSVLAAALRREAPAFGATVLGPAPAPLSLIAGRRRFHCLLKGQDWAGLRALYQAALAGLGQSPHLRLQLDLDPVDML